MECYIRQNVQMAKTVEQIIRDNGGRTSNNMDGQFKIKLKKI